MMCLKQPVSEVAGRLVRRTPLALSALAAAAWAFGATTGTAALFVNPGSHVLLENQSGQTIQWSVFNDGSSAVLIDSLEFFAIIGDGGPAAGSLTAVPKITGFDLHTGTPFASNFSPEVLVSPLSGADGVIQGYISTTSGSVSIPTGLTPIATLTIDTTGFFVGDDPWPLAMHSSTLEVGSSFVLLGDTVAAEFFTGEISLTAVPEPSHLAMAVSVGLLGFGLWRRHRSAGM
jgi:hypothetical protein